MQNEYNLLCQAPKSMNIQLSDLLLKDYTQESSQLMASTWLDKGQC